MSTSKIVHLQVDDIAPRLDQYLSQELPHFSRSQLKKLIARGQVLVDNKFSKASATLYPGDVITLHLPSEETSLLQPENIGLNIIFEDDQLLVVNKPAGMVVHPAEGHSSGTLVNALLAYDPELITMAEVDADSAKRPGIVHRLDQGTSGLIVVTRTPAALHHLRQQFKARTVEKIYLALVFDHLQSPQGVIDVPLGRDPHQRQKFAPRANGKAARTHYRVIETLHHYSLLEIGLETGRTHQIRVHLAWLKCPVVGDTLYGRKRNALGLKRQFLHAWQLRFEHPRTYETVHFEAPISHDLQSILEDLRK